MIGVDFTSKSWLNRIKTCFVFCFFFPILLAFSCNLKSFRLCHRALNFTDMLNYSLVIHLYLTENTLHVLINAFIESHFYLLCIHASELNRKQNACMLTEKSFKHEDWARIFFFITKWDFCCMDVALLLESSLSNKGQNCSHLVIKRTFCRLIQAIGNPMESFSARQENIFNWGTLTLWSVHTGITKLQVCFFSTVWATLTACCCWEEQFHSVPPLVLLSSIHHMCCVIYWAPC